MRSMRTRWVAGSIAVAALASVTIVERGMSSDHQDTPEVELNSRLDLNDVYAFPGSSEDRIVLVMTTQSPISPAQTNGARFDPNALYELKIDNNGDAVEDLVLQFQFDDVQGGGQTVGMFGPAAPLVTGRTSRVATATPTMTGSIAGTLTSGTGAAQVQLFAGPRDDPFYIDLEQFFRIVPDRRPAHGPASLITKSADAFRPKDPQSPGPFDPNHGAAMDFLRGLNAMAIVVEMPESMVKGSGSNIGVWATVSR